MRRKGTIKTLSSSESSDDEPLSNLKNGKQKKPSNPEDSSSESDIENYLQKPDKIDLDSPFFKLEKTAPPEAPVGRLTDSESEHEAEEPAPTPSKLNFSHLHDYTKKLEEAKRHVDEYNARRQAKEKEMNIDTLLAAGETRIEEFTGDLHSSDFESCSDSEKEGWEEVKEEEKTKEAPKEGLQITVEMPGAVKKKKGVDLLLAIKRRINRVRKENQVLIHKVHLLCWIAHGNHVSSAINSRNVLALALSLLPSQQCYPADRTDLKYLEQVLKWYRGAVTNVEKPVPADQSLEEILEAQIAKKQALNKTMLVYIFAAIMRALGIQCRLVLSLQVEPLRPPNSELHSLSTKEAAPSKEGEAAGSGKAKASKPSPSGGKKKAPGSKEAKASAPPKPETTDSRKSRSKETVAEKASASKTTSSERKASTKGQKTDLKEPRASRSSASVAAKLAATDSKKSRPTRSKEPSGGKVSASKAKVAKSAASEAETASSKVPNPKGTPLRSKSTSDATKPKTDSEPSEGKASASKAKVAKKPSASAAETASLKVPNPTPVRSKSTGDAPKPRTSSRLKTKSTSDAPQIKIKLKDPKKTRNTKTIPQLDGANDDKSPKPNLKKLKQKEEAPCPVKTHPKRLKTKVSKYKDSSDSEDDFKGPFSPRTNGANLKKLKNYDVRSDVVALVKKRIKEQKDLDKMKKVKKRKSTNDEEDSDYVPEAVKKKRESEDDFAPSTVKVKRRVPAKPDLEESKSKKKQGVDVWTEVFLEAEEKWISVDVIKGQVHCVNELYTRATHPISYVVGWNNDNTIKDITRRYCNNFNTVTRKLRVDAKWWEATVKPFLGRKTARDKEEDDELERQQLEKPLPTSIAEYKNHPLYVLKRHLLKFEALYPPDPPTLGFVRNEPVYSRACVYVLHSRDIWLKHAKVVKLGEQPYKIVKARPRWDKLSNKIVTDQLLEIFGPWQVQDYDPPTAENGVVPRNAFGNVELFKPCMIPKGTVHLKLPGLNKIAKRMNRDCAPALTGFDFHGGWNHPVYDGFIVCEEFADELVAAWEIEQDEIVKREQEKVDKRVYGNWKRLIRGLLIRERLKVKYEFGESSGTAGGGKKTAKAPKFSTKKRKIESGSDSD